MEERRILSDSKICIRSTENDSRIVDGYAAVFNRESKLISEDGKVFIEIIDPNAFDFALERDDLNVVGNRDHDNYKMLCRTKSNTLSLSVDDYGLKYTFSAPNTTLGDDTLELIRRGDLYESSFRYTVKPSNIEWFRGDDGILRRRILKIEKLKDIALVIDGAFSDTNISVRGLKEFEEREEKIRSQELEDYYINLIKQFYEKG